MNLIVIFAALLVSVQGAAATPTFDPRFAASRSTVAKEAGVRWVHQCIY